MSLHCNRLDGNLLKNNKIMKKIVLTDFSQPFWKNVDLTLVEIRINSLNKQKTIFGQIGYPEDNFTDTDIKKYSHIVENITYTDNKIYGDVKFLENDNGQIAKALFDKKHILGLRGLGKSIGIGVLLVDIITWDLIPPELSLTSVDLIKTEKYDRLK